MDKQNISFQKKISLFYDVHAPKAEKALPLLIALHGYGENKEKMMHLLKSNINEDCVMVSLQAPFPHIVPPVIPGKPIKYGFGWITSFNPREAIELHQQAVDQVIENIMHVPHIKISKIILLGFSQSVALNFRYVFSRINKINGVIAVCGGLPGDWSQAAYKASETNILYIGCKSDLIYPPKLIQQNAAQLRAMSKSVDVQIIDCKHEIAKESFKKINLFVTKD